MSMRRQTFRVLVALPCLNEEKSVADVIAKVKALAVPGATLSVLVVDDGSRDRTAELARAAGAVVVSHGRNLGLGSAFRTSVKHALETGADALVTIDADGQFAAEDIPKILAPVLNGEADFVTASRFMDKEYFPEAISGIKAWGNRQMSRLVSALANQKFYDVSCGFRAYSRIALLSLNLHGRFTYTHEVFLSLSFRGLRILEVPTKVTYFADRKSRMAGNIPRYAFRTALIILRCYRDYHPLKFFWTPAAGSFALASLLAAGFFGHYLLTGAFTPHLWAGFLSGFFFMVALVLFLLGLCFDMFDRLRENQERLLVELKELKYGESAEKSAGMKSGEGVTATRVSGYGATKET